MLAQSTKAYRGSDEGRLYSQATYSQPSPFTPCQIGSSEASVKFSLKKMSVQYTACLAHREKTFFISNIHSRTKGVLPSTNEVSITIKYDY